MKPDIILIGGGGHCRACIDVIEVQDIYRIAGIVDLAEKKGRDIFGYPYIGTDDDLPDLVNPNTHFLITLGQIKTPARRIALFEKIKAMGGTLPVIQSPLAHVSRHADIQEGTIIMHHALVNAGARVGKNCIVNTKALVEHDVVVEDHCHISTNCVLNGESRIGASTFVGSGAVVRENVRIGQNCIIAAGCKIMKNVADNKICN